MRRDAVQPAQDLLHPHGGGGPGFAARSGRAPRSRLPALPARGPRRRSLRLERAGERPTSIGRVRSFHGNFGVMVRAYAYIRELGAAGCGRSADMAVLKPTTCAFKVATISWCPTTSPACTSSWPATRGLEPTGTSTLDVAKRLVDHGFHPPTVVLPADRPRRDHESSRPRRRAGRRWTVRRRARRHRRRGSRAPERLHDAPHVAAVAPIGTRSRRRTPVPDGAPGLGCQFVQTACRSARLPVCPSARQAQPAGSSVP